jgi:hypothetical protein
VWFVVLKVELPTLDCVVKLLPIRSGDDGSFLVHQWQRRGIGYCCEAHPKAEIQPEQILALFEFPQQQAIPDI